MILLKENIDLFQVDEKYKLAHCISADYSMGAGIAKTFNKKYGLEQNLKQLGYHEYPTCIFVNPVFNLITKQNYWDKPTYESLTKSLISMRYTINKIRRGEKFYLAMPKIGCGLDKLDWEKVQKILEDLFYGVDIEILVCFID